MTDEEYRERVNPCWGCDCYDEDMGCTMPTIDLQYACPDVYGKEDEDGKE